MVAQKEIDGIEEKEVIVLKDVAKELDKVRMQLDAALHSLARKKQLYFRLLAECFASIEGNSRYYLKIPKITECRIECSTHAARVVTDGEHLNPIPADIFNAICDEMISGIMKFIEHVSQDHLSGKMKELHEFRKKLMNLLACKELQEVLK